jgi:hypothetical protein
MENIKSKLTQLWVNTYTSMCSKFAKLSSKFITVKKIYVVNNTNYNIYLQYLFVKFLLFLQQIPVIKYIIYCPLHYLNKTYHTIKLKLIDNITDYNIILHNINLVNICDFVNKFHFDINEKIMHHKSIIIDIKHNNTSIKKLLDSYADKSKKYNHTIKNILQLKKIKVNDNDIITVSYLHFCKKNQIDYKINDVIDKHISDVYKLS